MPVRCSKNTLWLSRKKGLPFAIISSRRTIRAQPRRASRIAVPTGERRAQFSQELFSDLELLVSKGQTYRGRIISLEGQIDPMGGGSTVKVHSLAKVNRDDVNLPSKTLATLIEMWPDSEGAGTTQIAAVSGAEGTLILWPARRGQNLHDSPSRFAATQPYNLIGNGRAGGLLGRVLQTGTLSAAFHDGH
jgi:hypothetical protein